jgi:hypothetical protein
MSRRPVAQVTEADKEAVAWAADPANGDKVVNILFGPFNWRFGEFLDPRDHAAVGTLLCHQSPSDWQEFELQVLAVAHAHGRVQGMFPPTAGGAILLAGEIAARFIHRQLADEHGPYGFEALTSLIEELWPRRGVRRPAPVSGHPSMALHRMLQGPVEPLLTSQQEQTLRVLSHVYGAQTNYSLRRQQLLLRCAARVAFHTVQADLRRHPEEFVAVRQEILAARSAAAPDAAPEVGPEAAAI